MTIQPAFLETWLSQYEHALYNLGESSVDNLSLKELLAFTKNRLEEHELLLGNNDTYGSLSLRTAISSLDEAVTVDEILVTAGTTEAILLYFQARFHTGANVIVPVPTFHVLYEIPIFFGYEVRKLELKVEEGFRIDPQKLEALVDENTCTIVLNTPQNPTGVVHSDEEIANVIRIAEMYDADILVDEHYRFLPHQSKIDILPTLYGRSPRILTLGSTGKCFGCVGLRTGWLVGDRKILEACHFFKDYTTHTVSVISDWLTADILNHRTSILPRYRQTIATNIQKLTQFIADHSGLIDWVKPDAGTVAFPFFTQAQLKSQLIAQDLVEQHQVLVLPGEGFDRPGHFRIALGISPDKFQYALSKLDLVMNTYL